MVGRDRTPGCRGAFGRTGKRYGVSEDLSRRESDDPTLPTSRLERSRPAADATREVVERWLLVG